MAVLVREIELGIVVWLFVQDVPAGRSYCMRGAVEVDPTTINFYIDPLHYKTHGNNAHYLPRK